MRQRAWRVAALAPLLAAELLAAPAAAARIPPRPAGARGHFLRVVSINDVYKLANYPHVRGCIDALKGAAPRLGCTVVSCINGDFLSPCIHSALDGGRTMMEALNAAGIEYACLGNHEFDLGTACLAAKLPIFAGTVINSNVHEPLLAHLPRWRALSVGARTVALGGFVTGDPAIYSAANRPAVGPIPEAVEQVWEQATASLGRAPDLLLPMTHQPLSDDRALAEWLLAHAELSGRAPVLLGGHEHEKHIVAVPPAGSAGASGADGLAGPMARGPDGVPHPPHVTIVKMGADASELGIVDVWWPEDGAEEEAAAAGGGRGVAVARAGGGAGVPVAPRGAARARVHDVPAAAWEAEAAAALFAARKQERLAALMRAPLATLPDTDTPADSGDEEYAVRGDNGGGAGRSACLTTRHVRRAPSAVASFLATLVRRGLRAERVELCLLHAGCVRGGAEYAPGAPFTIGDLHRELTFPTEMAIVRLPGSVLADAVRWSRALGRREVSERFLDGGGRELVAESAAFLHADERACIDPRTAELRAVGGVPLEAEREYTVALPQPLLLGMDDLRPLCEHVRRARVPVPAADVCAPAKNVVITHCMRAAWRRLVGYGRVWTDPEAEAATEAAAEIAISPAEIERGIERVFAQMDADGNGDVDLAELSGHYARVTGDEAPPQALMTEMLRALDADGDGRVSRAELKAIAL